MYNLQTVLCASVVGVLISTAEGLKCRSDEDRQSHDHFKDVARLCMSQVSTMGGSSDHDSKSYGDEGYGDENNGGRNTGHQEPRQSSARPRYRRQSQYDYNDDDDMRGNNNNMRRNNKNQGDGISGLNSAPLEHVEPCVVHCIFRQMHMLDKESMPDRQSVVTVMSHNIRDNKVKDFVEDSVDECFESIDYDSKKGKCEFTKDLALCLEEKGRSTCDDWDEEADDNKTRNKRPNKNPRRDDIFEGEDSM